MAGRNNHAIANALEAMAQVLQGEAKDWCNNACGRLEAVGTDITWVMFRAYFLDNYFLEDVCSKKKIEFLELKQGNLTVAKYAAKFEEIVKFYPHCNSEAADGSKRIKFGSAFRPEIKQGIGYQEIIRFPMMVNKCRLYDEDSRARFAHYQSFSGKKGKDQSRGKLYSALADKGKQKVDQKATGGKERSGGGTHTSVRCFKCREFRRHVPECKSTTMNWFKCWKLGHRVIDCRSNNLTCFNYGEQSHISSQCKKPKNAYDDFSISVLIISKK
ncbi:uncharacterized protein LOC127082220 [Lathyrus oleraceus]|uniref:uncharacterized protein LOC127082220 n=1 Tax=Pisum sativum TaxID=3888 RepID=UPI0021D25BFB|nr:uncharacterized protein LOC127082220 [Pisum sativum]